MNIGDWRFAMQLLSHMVSVWLGAALTFMLINNWEKWALGAVIVLAVLSVVMQVVANGLLSVETQHRLDAARATAKEGN